jgi:ribosomal protein S27E
MIFGVTLFLRLAQVLFRPNRVRFECPTCGLIRHDPDAVHCKHCGTVLHIPTEGPCRVRPHLMELATALLVQPNPEARDAPHIQWLQGTSARSSLALVDT